MTIIDLDPSIRGAAERCRTIGALPHNVLGAHCMENVISRQQSSAPDGVVEVTGSPVEGEDPLLLLPVPGQRPVASA